MNLIKIDMVFTYGLPNDTEQLIHASIDEMGQWNQWGGTKEQLSTNVPVIESITNAINEGQFMVGEE